MLDEAETPLNAVTGCVVVVPAPVAEVALGAIPYVTVDDPEPLCRLNRVVDGLDPYTPPPKEKPDPVLELIATNGAPDTFDFFIKTRFVTKMCRGSPFRLVPLI